MQNTLLHKKIPTLLALILLIIGIGATTFFAQRGALFIGRAAPSTQAENVTVTNITDRSFVVTFTTPNKTASVVSYGTSVNLGETTLDDRDKKTGTVTPFTSHYITIPNLRPSTTYYFSITNGQDTYLDNGKPYQVDTGPALASENPNSFEVSGNILFPNIQEKIQGLVYVSLDSSQLISQLSNSDGTFKIPLVYIRSKDLKSYLKIDNNNLVTTEINIPSLGNSKITSLVQESNPLPPITISQNYNFSSPINQQENNTPESAKSSFPLSTFENSDQTLKINIPEDDAKFTDLRPTFKGTAPIGSKVTIEIHSDENITQEITTNSKGEWSFRPSANLSSGQHTIKVTGNDSSGSNRTITRSFTILPSGSQVEQSATPSATIQPTRTPTIQPTAQPTTMLSPTPTLIPTSTPIPQIFPTPTVIQKPIEDPGSNNTTLGLIIGATTFLGAIALLALSRRKLL